MTPEHPMKFKFYIMPIRLLEYSHIHSFTYCLWYCLTAFGATVAELSSCDRDDMTYKA